METPNQDPTMEENMNHGFSTAPNRRRISGNDKGAIILLFCLLVSLGCGLGSSFTQTSDGKIVGTVFDSSRAAIPGAAVTVKNERTTIEHTTTTNEQGYFVVPGLQPSSYTVTVSASGFQPTSSKNILLAVGQVHAVDFVVNPAGTAEQITVTDQVDFDTSSARMGVNVTSAEVKDLPLNGRQLSQLYLLTPGAVNVGTGTFDNIRFSGQA